MEAGRRGRGAGALVVAGLFALGAGGQRPEVFRSEAGRFSVSLPGAPRHSASSHPTLAGPVHSAEYLVEAGPVELRVELHDVPAVASLFLSDGALLERAQRDLLSDDQAEEHRDAVAELRGYPAREVVYRLGVGDGRAARALLVLVGRRLYILVALHPLGAPEDPSLDRFFGSFEAWEP